MEKKDVIDDCTLVALRSLRRAILAAQVGAEEGDEFFVELEEKLSEFEALLAEKAGLKVRKLTSVPKAVPHDPTDRENCKCDPCIYRRKLCNQAVDQKRVDKALKVALRYGGTDGSHHKAWVIDQMVRHLTGLDYGKVIEGTCAGVDGPATYTWDIGVPP